jgi:hypothetical protein
MSFKSRWIVGFVVASIFASSAASAQQNDGNKDEATVAAQFFRAARAAYDRKEFRAAALAFLEAYRRVPKSAAVYDAGRAWEAAGERELACDAFNRALRAKDLAPEDTDYAQAHLQTLSAQLATVDVTAPVGASIVIRGVDRGTIPATIYLAPGSHEVHALRRDGSDVSHSIVLAQPGDHQEVALPDVVIAEKIPTPEKKPPPPPPPPKRSPLGAWLSFGGATALAVGGAITYDFFVTSRSTFEASGSRDSSAHDDAQKWRTVTLALWGSAVAFGALGGVLLLTSTSAGSSPTTASLRLNPNGLAFTIVH